MNLKTPFVIAIIFFFIENGIAQSLSELLNEIGRVSVPIQTNGGIESFRPSNFASDKITFLGSEFIDDKFSEATVNKGSQYFDLRYNNYSGYFEYKKSPKEIINLSKENNTEISFKDGRQYTLKQYKINKTNKEDYLLSIGIKDYKVKLYKLESIDFIPYRESSNSYQEKKLPEYKLKKPLYFVEYENSITPIQKSNDLEKAFPNKSKEIKHFLKQNKINFASDEFLIVQRFLNSIL